MDVMPPSDQRELRKKILSAWSILQGEDLLDFMGHVSARISKEAFLITPRMPKSGDLRKDTILTISSSGEFAKDRGSAPIELPLHEIIYKHTPNVGCVIHTHPKHAVALSASGRNFKAVHQLCLPFIEGVPVFEDFSMIDSIDKATEMLGVLSNHRAMFLKHHGAVVTGATVEEACVLTIWLEKCAEIQLAAGELGVQGISKNEEAQRLLEHQLRTTVTAAWNYYNSKHGASGNQ
jgi:ribulose-5-phosphate 4-epimerase/fuculose-1-phosphate aldolase